MCAYADYLEELLLQPSYVTMIFHEMRPSDQTMVFPLAGVYQLDNGLPFEYCAHLIRFCYPTCTVVI